MHVEIRTMPELRTAALRHVGPYDRISEAFERLDHLAGEAGLLHVKPTLLAIYYDDPATTALAELRSDAALVLSKDAPLPAGMHEARLPGGRHAVTTHVGPYQKLGDVWARFKSEWLPGSGERLGAGNSFEIYVNTPGEVPPEQLRTELYLPLAD